MRRPISPRYGLTLIELLVMLAIVAILIGLATVGIVKVRSAMARTECANNLTQLGIASHAAFHQHRRMPPAFGFYPVANDIYSGSNGLGNTFFHLLPFLQQQNLYYMGHYQPRSRGRQQNFMFYTANGVNQTQVPMFNCPADPTLMPGINPVTGYAPSSYAGNYLVFGNVDANYASKNAQGIPRLGESFPDGTSQTILFAEKYASSWISAANNQGTAYKGGCHWAYFQADCQNPFFAYYELPFKGRKSATDPNAVGSTNSHFQVQTNAAGSTNPCLPSTGHSAMNVCVADGSVRPIAASMNPSVSHASRQRQPGPRLVTAVSATPIAPNSSSTIAPVISLPRSRSSYV